MQIDHAWGIEGCCWFIVYMSLSLCHIIIACSSLMSATRPHSFLLQIVCLDV